MFNIIFIYNFYHITCPNVIKDSIHKQNKSFRKGSNWVYALRKCLNSHLRVWDIFLMNQSFNRNCKLSLSNFMLRHRGGESVLILHITKFSSDWMSSIISANIQFFHYFILEWWQHSLADFIRILVINLLKKLCSWFHFYDMLNII